MDEGGKDAVLPAEQLLWLVKLQDGTAFQDNHQVCAQDGVHTVLGQAGGGRSACWGDGQGSCGHLSCSLEEEACGQNVQSLWGLPFPGVAVSPSLPSINNPFTPQQVSALPQPPGFKSQRFPPPPIFYGEVTLA